MSKFQLEYFNSYDLAKASSSKLIGLSGKIPPHGYFMVSDDSLLLCYRLGVQAMSLGLSSTAGMVQVLSHQQTSPGGPAVPVLEDYVGWSKSAAAGAQTLPSNTSAFLQRQPADPQNNPAINAAGAGSWQAVQPDGANPCNLVTTSGSPVAVPGGMGSLLPGSEPPATILSADGGGTAAPVMPPGNIGLMAPSVSEALPNPAGTGNDSTDEFIEIYNPNAKPFELTGFSLQVGLTGSRSHNFPAGTMLPPQSFTTFSSEKTKLSLSNASGQVKLIDPFGNSLSATGAYDTAKDGLAWALAKGKWYWTTQPTPGKANVIKQPPATAKKSTAKKSASKAKPATAVKRLKAASASNTSSTSDGAGLTPLHPTTLAIVGGLALLYGAYEYRADLANHFHQLRRHFRIGRGDRP